jgi:hypothetical protein
MDSNTHSNRSGVPPDPSVPPEPAAFPEPSGPVEVPEDLAGLAAAVETLAAQNQGRLSGAARAQRILAWRQLLDRQEGLWLQELADLDAHGAAGADQGIPAPSTAGWLQNRLRMAAGTAREAVQTAGRCSGVPCPRLRPP